MGNLIVIAKVTAVSGKSEQAKAALTDLIWPTLKEAGCLQYDLHQDNINPHVFYFYEIWESMVDLEQHGQSPHILGMREKTRTTILNTELSFMSKVSQQ